MTGDWRVEHVAELATSWRMRIQRHIRAGHLIRFPRSAQRVTLFDAIPRAADDQAAQAGAQTHEVTFDALFTRLERSIYGYLWRMLGDQQTAADLTQETFLRVWRHIDRLSAYERPETWVWRVATNLALNERRRLSTWNLQPLDDDAEGLAASDPAMRVAVHDHVHATLLALPEQLRAALTLREVYGLSFVEVGQVLGISPANARVTLGRARERFRQRYQRTEGVR